MAKVENNYFPVLGALGWTNSTLLTLDHLMSDFFIAEYSQTSIFYGQIASFPYLLQKYRDDPTGLTSATQETLLSYFRRYFNNVVVECTLANPDTEENNLSMSIYAEVTDNTNHTYTVARMGEIINGKFSRLININNTGAP